MSDPVLNLCTGTLPADAPQRTAPVPRRFWTGDRARFDASTLWYDAIAINGRTHLVCPRFFDLTAMVKAGRFSLSGTPARIARWRKYRRHEVIELDGTGEVLSFEGGDVSVASQVSPDAAQRFDGLNVHVALTLDNRPEWLADFARFHIQHHGLEAMVLFDNGSTTQTPDQIAATLRDAGLVDALVVPAALPYGPRLRSPHKNKLNFLQTALLNVARLRFFRRARAVLNCDIDELVWCDGASVFDLTAASRLGYLRFPGAWHVAPDGETARHRDHGFVQPGKIACSPKYCIAPKGPLGGFSRGVHALERAAFLRRCSPDVAQHWHCRNVSTDWKNWGRLRKRSEIAVDPVASEVLSQTRWS